MSIATKTGDDGTTTILGGKRIPKHDAQIEAYGALDEATCVIGQARQHLSPKQQKLLDSIQVALYRIMAYLSGAKLDKEILIIEQKKLDNTINTLENKLPKLTKFILPQGKPSTTTLHIARAIVRRAERRINYFLSKSKFEPNEKHLVQTYINRLSDVLFLLARTQEQKDHII